jgi:hypothetical protein
MQFSKTSVRRKYSGSSVANRPVMMLSIFQLKTPESTGKQQCDKKSSGRMVNTAKQY